ncbi:MAG: right-handed parallel beta-helix repeat-containing protein [Planctomycetota bacterium]|jgi:parallel beta-helix repeat protein
MRSILIIAVLLIFVCSGHAAIIRVPDDYPLIQQAIDAAKDGDEVHVSTGTYVEQIDFKGKAILVKALDGPEATIIDGGGAAQWAVVRFSSDEDKSSVLEGFTIRNSKYVLWKGGGILCQGSSPKLIGNVITDNMAAFGGGICCDGASPHIKGNIIRNNVAYSHYSSRGGGIYCDNGSAPIIEDNLIVDNIAYWEGGGVFCENAYPFIRDNLIEGNTKNGIYSVIHSSPEIWNNTIRGHEYAGIHCEISSPTIFGNIITENGHGIYCSTQAAPLISSNMISSNEALRGGGISCVDHSNPFIVNTTIYSNSASEMGGGLYCYDHSWPEILNTIFWGNDAPAGPEIAVFGSPSPSVLSIDYSDVQGGQGSIKIYPDSVLFWGDNMIDADPLFASSGEGDLHILYDSPCRNKGTKFGAWIPDEDFEGDHRGYPDPDIGADEFHNHLYLMGESVPGGEVAANVIGNPGTSPVALMIGTGILQTPHVTPWGLFHLAEPWNLVPLPSMPAQGLLSLPATIPLEPPAPYDIPMQALIGLYPGSLTNLGVLEIR